MADPEKLREISNYQSQVCQKIKPFAGSRFKYFQSLEQLFLEAMVNSTQKTARVQLYSEPKESYVRDVFAISGPPIAGKSFIGNIKKESLMERVQRMSRGGTFNFGEVSWEEDGEEAARKKGLILTPRDQVFDDAELEAANYELESTAASSIAKNEVTLVEVPGGATSTMVKGIWIGRQLGAKMLFNMEKRTGHFADLPKYRVYHIGLVGSQFLKQVNIPFREDYRSTQSLEEAQYLTWLYGKKQPEDEEEWLRGKVEGASEKQISRIESQIDGLALYLNNAGLVKFPLPKGVSLERALQSESISYTKGLQKAVKDNQSTRPRVIGALLEDFYFQVLGIEPKVDGDRVFVGYNNPTQNDLGIPDLRLLSNHMESRRKVA